jgi:hypothetical protein
MPEDKMDAYSGGFGIPECYTACWRRTFTGNLPASTDERATMNESSSGALGVPELRSPALINVQSNRIEGDDKYGLPVDR